MNINIRKAQSSDASSLAHIQVTSWRSAFRGIASDEYLDHRVSERHQVEDWKEILTDPEQVVFVAQEGSKVIGYAWAHREEDASIEWDSELISMHILPEHKRRGIGRKLFAAAASQLKEQGCTSLYLWVLEENRPAREFYEALGGQLAGKQQIELGDRELTEVAYGWKDIGKLEQFR